MAVRPAEWVVGELEAYLSSGTMPSTTVYRLVAGDPDCLLSSALDVPATVLFVAGTVPAHVFCRAFGSGAKVDRFLRGQEKGGPYEPVSRTFLRGLPDAAHCLPRCPSERPRTLPSRRSIS